MMKKKKIISSNSPVYAYMGYIRDAIANKEHFKYSEVNQLGARMSGKTTSDNIELVRAIFRAAKTKQTLFILIVRMHHKSIGDAGDDILGIVKEFKLPYKIWIGKRIIKVCTTTIQVRGCYTQNSNQISFLGFGIKRFKYGVVVFEEAKEFDEKTVAAVLVAIRGVKYQTVICRSNPYHLNNGFPQKCYRKVMYNENTLKNGSGNQFTELLGVVYHYMTCGVKPFLSEPNKAYLNSVLENNPMRANTEVYGLPGSESGMVFASLLNKINRNFVNQNGKFFTSGIDVGHVSSATAAVFFALDNKARKFYQLGEYWHCNETMRYKESAELASDIVAFFTKFQEQFRFSNLEVNIDYMVEHARKYV